jgi:hypothetical protein
MSPPLAFLLDMVALFVLGAIGIVMALGIARSRCDSSAGARKYQKR